MEGNDVSTLTAISPIDGRYFNRVSKFSDYFSEYALFKYRLFVEIKYLFALSDQKIIPHLTPKQKKALLALVENFSLDDAKKIKEIEKKIVHDVKSLEYFIKDKLGNILDEKIEFIHFALTTYDTDDTANALLLKDALEFEMYPKINELILKLAEVSGNWKSIVMLGRTHGQPAVPTTVGKEIAVFVSRLNDEFKILKSQKLSGKINGAIGNYNAHIVAYPKMNWIKFSKVFLHSLGLEPSILTTQYESYDHTVRVLDSLRRINYILVGFSQDMWRYISDGYFAQIPDKKEVSSSTMSQKVNPLEFEQAEAHLTMANSMFEFFVRKLPISRLQHDLTDKSIRRNIGTAFCSSYIAYNSILRGLKKVGPNEKVLKESLQNNWSIIAEGIQTVLRQEGYEKPYELLMEFTRGNKIVEKSMNSFIDKLEIKSATKKRLKNITPFTYVGLSKKLVEYALKNLK